MRSRFFEQTLDDGFGGVCDGKHPAIRFGLQPHPAFGEPSEGIGRLKSGERGNERPLTSRIAGAQCPRLKAGVRDIAASSAGNPHFAEKLGAFFEKRDIGRRIRLRASDGREEPRRSPADYYNASTLFGSTSFSH